MSDKAMAERIYNILKQKESLGMLGAGGEEKSEKKSKVGKKVAKRNPWINFIKEYQEKHGISYKEAMEEVKEKGLYKSHKKNKKCPKGKKLQKVKGYKIKRGRKNELRKAYNRCVAAGLIESS